MATIVLEFFRFLVTSFLAMNTTSSDSILSDSMASSLKRLEERIHPRLAVEAEFARLGHTYRHGPLHRFLDHKVQRPLLIAGFSLLGLYGQGKRNALQPIVRTIRLDFKDLPASFEGFRLMHLSDFHIDGVDGLAESLASVLRKTPCDLCVFTGDYRFDDRGECEEVYPRMKTVIDSIESRHGIFGILGNHDPGEAALRLQTLGVQMLVNDSARLTQDGESIWVVGLDDNFDYGRHDLPLAMEGVPPGAFKILLAHAPELFKEADALGIQLNLSGHTHAGQLRLPGIGAIRQNARCPKQFAWGAWQYGRLQGHTSAGVGCSTLPIRFCCPPEIVILELHRHV
jgi:predicted MPP superfamily phosphohydrolase